MTSSPSLIQIRNLSFRYLGTNINVLDNINLEISRGEVVIIAGRSGCGKSTLLRTLNGLIPHQHQGEYSGEVKVNGLTVAKSRMSEIAKHVGYVFQNPENQIIMFSVERDIAFGLENLSFETSTIRERVDQIMNLLNIRELALRAPHELSDGQKQRVAIAGALVMQPSVLILDEPTSLLDPHTARELISQIGELHRRLNITVLIVEHRLDLVTKIASRLVVMDKGRILFNDTPRKVLSESNISLIGVTEPSIVKLAKLMAFSPQEMPIDSSEMKEALLADRAR